MNILSAIGYNTQSNLKTAAGCGTEREQRHSTGGILKWQKIMKQTETNQTMRAKISGKVIPETAEKTVLRTNPKTAMATVTETKRPMNTNLRKTANLTDIDLPEGILDK